VNGGEKADSITIDDESTSWQRGMEGSGRLDKARERFLTDKSGEGASRKHSKGYGA
jgi:hypothetical protein